MKIIFLIIFIYLLINFNLIWCQIEKNNLKVFNQIKINNDIFQKQKEITFGEYQNYDFNFLIKHLTTKTPYYKSNHFIKKDENNNNNFKQQQQQCKLISIDFIGRHGSRMPEASVIKKMKKLQNEILKINKYIENDGEFGWLKNYTVPYKIEIAGNLLTQGQLEHYHLSKRFLKRFPNYFGNYKPQTTKISSTIISRTGVSASSFAYGLFEGTGVLGDNFQPVHIETSTLDKDILLSFFLNCDKYNNALRDQSINDNEREIWKQMKYPSIGIEIKKRLGIPNSNLNDWELSNSIINTIFLSCVYDVAIGNITNHWCSLLNKQNILDLEYSKDLDDYWLSSYGNKINYEISSPLLKDIFNHFDSIINLNNNSNNNSNSDNDNKDEENNDEFSIDNNKYPKNILRFAHSETVIPLMSLLGLFKDEYHLFANLTSNQIINRNFKTSVIVPYSTNLVMFLYDCGGENDFKILVEHNESPILIPGCNDIFCNYQLFKSLFSNVINFNWDNYCS
ncbi:hypothetical protein DDB_G0286993 [Dictyostelium discoideum AX4]|uniref:2,3-bisphosphoglycerate 3-phosphatase n=1 Tax=Dictyostelium discoideum TaxID=44689 RepID=Q54L08_DICDI|nr:hypothetical protein DDB_G0286993 [Dictyostelium discoideum AX4]EAL63948.1 hypothetical protein DDB_G0286993 [Dictyostelium discoideum AX4]|eukprot:XP_637449.1 hypothetical protein DDB_G0286993 [Dictyostelium discoideum AX4]